MKRYQLIVWLLGFLPFTVLSQSRVAGQVSDEHGEGLIGANVFLKGTYDGATTARDGSFGFMTYETGSQLLVISFIGYETQELPVEIGQTDSCHVVLKEAFNAMEAVTISAGAFEANDEKKTVVLKSLDIAMTAGATADITGALNTLPGTQKVGESGKLFVRGGTADETRVYVDGVEASNYYAASASGLPTRSRYSPFMFKGTYFSTGGYSAEYGQALSSALILNTKEVETENEVNVSVYSVGVDAGITRAWENRSLFTQIDYRNLGPYYQLVPQRYDWQQSPENWTGTVAFKNRFKNGGVFKMLGMGYAARYALHQPSVLNEEGYNAISITNQNGYASATLQLPVGDKDFLYVGSSSAINHDDQQYNQQEKDAPDYRQHVKLKYVHEFNPKISLNSGAEWYMHSYHEKLVDSTLSWRPGYHNMSYSAYSEVNQYLSEVLVVRAGARLEYQSVMQQPTVSPRLSMACKLNEYAQVSFASGLFFENPTDSYLSITRRVKQEQATHYILNFQYMHATRIFRVEPYYKRYGQLVTYADEYTASTFTNNGKGYAYGVDVFWRDRGGIKNLDYWVSYSFIQSERRFQDYPVMARPTFVSAHNLSLVMKRFFSILKTQIGATYSISSGRPYEDPNKTGFNNSTAPVYQDLSFNLAWLPNPSVIIYLSATNLTGARQVFGYRYADTPDAAGYFASDPVRLSARRFLFIGCLITIGAFNKQLENL